MTRSRTRPRRLVLTVALVGLLVLSGCAGLLDGSGDGDPDATPTPTSSPSPTDDGPSVDEAQLRSDALAALAEIEEYRLTATRETVVRGPRSREVTVTDRARIDRAEREFRRNRTVVARGQRVNYTQYLVNRTLYARSQVYVRQYGSAWVRTGVTDNFSRFWRLQDVAGQLRLVLERASAVEVTGVETVGGERTYRTRVRIGGEAYRGVLFDIVGIDPEQARDVNVTRVEYVYWLDTETARPLRTTTVVRFSATVNGRSVRQNVTTTARYSYGSVSVDLPPAADDAVNVSGGRLVVPRRPALALRTGPSSVGDTVRGRTPLATGRSTVVGPGPADVRVGARAAGESRPTPPR